MPKKNQETAGKNGQVHQEITTIRDIIMGQQIAAYDARFERLEQRINQVEEILHTRIDQIEHSLSEKGEIERDNLSDRINQLEKLVNSKIINLNEKIDHVTNEDKKKLGKMMADLSQKLIGD